MKQSEIPTHGSSGFLADLALFMSAILVTSSIKQTVCITGGEQGILNEISSLCKEATMNDKTETKSSKIKISFSSVLDTSPPPPAPFSPKQC